jgi:AraC-like DNA-binding protein/mannose-6-phosphate isomerase-like protein (cupin superfamily)
VQIAFHAAILTRDNRFMGTPLVRDLSVRRYGAAPGAHAHDHFQVLCVLDGTLELEVGGRGARVAAGQGQVLLPGERHDFDSRDGSRCLVLDTSDPCWAALPRAPRHAQAVRHLAAYLGAALDAGLVSTLGPELLAQAWGGGTPAAPRVRRGVDWAALALWLEAHLAKPLTAARIAEQVHLSESQFRARCLDELGLSPMQWVRERRLARAAALRATGLSVAEAARRSGYASPSALTAAMQRGQIGVSRR